MPTPPAVSSGRVPHRSKERLPFELDPQIIHHIIYSQAGSIGKAIIELLMNSVDASASAVKLSITKEGFECSDDGGGFATLDDVRRHFGRFGTPHVDGDATYGRFRLGRGQIMAHASTSWRSNAWQMDVDTRAMGYNYDVSEVDQPLSGCIITGHWYAPLSDVELMSAIQEIRDLVRYTPISVLLNGRVISRDPRSEKWDAEDEFAWYRVATEGAVSLYNLGVLVRHDPGRTWGAGGVVVSKRAIALNVSRTEILRGTCPVWREIAKKFSLLATRVRSRLGEHRKTEVAREKAAQTLLGGASDIAEVYASEEVITLLPGKAHVTIPAFLARCRARRRVGQGRSTERRFTVVEDAFDVPTGEAIAREKVAVVVHPKTLERFGCHSAQDLVACLERVHANMTELNGDKGRWLGSGGGCNLPELVAFATLRDAFVMHTAVEDGRVALDKEARRAWTALRTILRHYAALLTGGERRDSSAAVRGGRSFEILLGRSNVAEAWTDGESYIAISIDIVKRLRETPLKAAAYAFSLVEHEVAHQGDSLDCGHDEAFYQRFHDLTVGFAEERQWFLHAWLMRYTVSLEGEGKAARSVAWRERYLVDRVGTGRMKLGLPRAIEDLHSGAEPFSVAEDPQFVNYVNSTLLEGRVGAQTFDWELVLDLAHADQLRICAEELAVGLDGLPDIHWLQSEQRKIDEAEHGRKSRIAESLGVSPEEVSWDAVWHLSNLDLPTEQLRKMWLEAPWGRGEARDNETQDNLFDENDAHWDADWQQDAEELAANAPVKFHYSPEAQSLIREGETCWALERNAAAAGFADVEHYLRWRASLE